MLQRLLKEILEKEGVKRYQIWKKLGINQGQLSSFFYGKKSISLEKLERIIDFLGYEILLVRKGRIGRERHQKKLIEDARIAEIVIEQIIGEFEGNHRVYVRTIDVCNGKAKIIYDEGKSEPFL